MNKSRIFGCDSLPIILLTALYLIIGNSGIFGQINNYQEQDRQGYEDLTKLPVVNFDSPETGNVLEREERKLKNARYDKKVFVRKKVHPNTDGISADYDKPDLSPVPVIESSLIITGRIVDARASLSNDKSGIYSEYTVQIGEILKGNGLNQVMSGGKIKVDRAGRHRTLP